MLFPSGVELFDTRRKKHEAEIRDFSVFFDN